MSGIDLGNRAVRNQLKLMDERGVTRSAGGKDGRSITKSGIEEVDSASVGDRVGLVNTEIGVLAYQSSFNPETRTGDVPINVSLFSLDEFSDAMKTIKYAFKGGLGLSELVAIGAEGKELGGLVVPPGRIGLVTVSQIVICGAWLKAGIPVAARFGGILQIQDHEARRFVDLIEYTGSSLDPSEIFIAGKMTSIKKVAMEGNGKMLASLWEIPALARPKAEAIIEGLKMVGMQGLIALGRTGEPVCELPVAINKVGVLLADGLNPVAAAVEAGIDVENHAMSGVFDFRRLQPIQDYRLVRR